MSERNKPAPKKLTKQQLSELAAYLYSRYESKKKKQLDLSSQQSKAVAGKSK